LLGRTFLPEEDVTPEKDFVAVISHRLWESRYGSDPNIAGKTISLDLKSYSVVGVLPAEFRALSGPADVWVPVHTMNGPDELDQTQSHSWQQVARLKPGMSTQQASSAVSLLGPRIDEAYPI